MQHIRWIAFLLVALLFHYGYCITTSTKKVAWISGKPPGRSNDRCATKIETRLESMKKLDPPTSRDASLDLSGYALHQRLRSLSYDMYVTGMRVRVPGKVGWFRVEQCSFNPLNRSLDTRLLFRDLAVSGQVKLYDESRLSQDPRIPPPVDACNMTLRFRRAGLEISVKPQKTTRGYVDIESRADFIEPNFVSVHAYGCKEPVIEHRQGLDDDEFVEVGSRISRQQAQLEEEMENVFLKGVKTLLTTYMQKQLEPALRETLLSNLGYTISYGKR